MPKLLLLIGSLLVGALLIPVAFWLADYLPIDGSRTSPLASWRWDKAKASLTFSITQYLPDYDVEIVDDKQFYTPINIRDKKDSTIIYSFKEGHQNVVFTRWKNTLYIAEHCPMRSGCSVVAVDLSTRRQVWKSHLRGIGPTAHSEYSNSVNIETDGAKVIVYGNESHGKYVEHVDMKTGKTLLNRAFDVSEWE
jgi:hypothetical protein